MVTNPISHAPLSGAKNRIIIQLLPSDMDAVENSADPRELTYGEKAVGLTFNPSGDADVQRVKKLYAAIIDLLAERRSNTPPSETARLLSVAITEAQTAQMWAVKGITFRE